MTGQAERGAGPIGEVVLIASWLDEEHVDRVRDAAPEVEVIYEPGLLRKPRYPADHKGAAVERSAEEEAAWLRHLARATILFDFDKTHLEDLPDVAPRVRWIQATSAGIGQLVRRLDYAGRIPETVLTTARGVHARPLAEFALLAMLAHTRGLLRMTRQQQNRHWARYAGADLEGRTVLVVGLGAVGREIARFARAVGARVLGVRRHPEAADASEDAEEVHPPEALHTLLAGSDFLILAAPHTDETEGMIGAAELASLPPGAVLINVGRGALVDEPALIDALRAGHLGGAYLDVFREEPLPPESPLWTLPNVLVSPHSGSTSDRENGRIVELFCDNLRRYLEGRPLRNVLDTARLY